MCRFGSLLIQIFYMGRLRGSFGGAAPYLSATLLLFLLTACFSAADRGGIPSRIVIADDSGEHALPEHRPAREIPLLPPPPGINRYLGGPVEESTGSDPPGLEHSPLAFDQRGITLLGAVGRALRLDRAIEITRESYEGSRGTLVSAGGAFEWTASGSIAFAREYEPLTDQGSAGYQAAGLADDADQWDTVAVSAGFRKKTRSGPSISQSLSVDRNDYRVTGNDTTNKGQVQFAVNIPLLKGRGLVSAGVGERAAMIDLRAARFEIIHQSAGTVRNVARAYWAYLAARKQLELAQGIERHAGQLLEETRLLIEAEQLPRASLNSLRANLADKRVSRISREFDLKQARNSLGMAMGVPAASIAAIPSPLSDFPAPAIDGQLEDQGLLKEFIKQALAGRADYLARLERLKSTEAYLKAARRDLLPTLDMSMMVGYESLQEGDGLSRFGDGLFDNMTEPEWQLGVNFDLPIGNDAARGNLLKRMSSWRIARLQAADLKEQIQADVALGIAGLQSHRAELAASRTAVEIYTLAVDDEREKFKMGYTTILDLIDAEDRLNQSSMRLITARLRLAQALVDLRFASGSLFIRRGDELQASLATMTSMELFSGEE